MAVDQTRQQGMATGIDHFHTFRNGNLLDIANLADNTVFDHQRTIGNHPIRRVHREDRGVTECKTRHSSP